MIWLQNECRFVCCLHMLFVFFFLFFVVLLLFISKILITLEFRDNTPHSRIWEIRVSFDSIWSFMSRLPILLLFSLCMGMCVCMRETFSFSSGHHSNNGKLMFFDFAACAYRMGHSSICLYLVFFLFWHHFISCIDCIENAIQVRYPEKKWCACFFIQTFVYIL